MADAMFEVKSSLAGVEFFLRTMDVTDVLGRPFSCDVQLYSETADIKPADILGMSITVSVLKADETKRYFNGVVTQFLNAGHLGGYQVYHLTLRPWLWLLTHTADCQIFQEQAVTDVIEKIFKDQNGFSDFRKSLSETYSTWTYCAQYRESDFDFVSRLMEHEGMYYFFEHEDGKHTVVLADSANSHSPIEGTSDLPFRRPGEAYVDQEHIYRWQRTDRIQSGNFKLNAFDFEKPKANLLSASQVTRSNSYSDFEVYDYPGRFTETSDGERYAKHWLQELQCSYSTISGAGQSFGLATGGTFSLTEHPRADENGEYLIVSTKIRIESGEIEQFGDAENKFEVEFHALSTSDQFRPARTTPKPLVRGPQTAIVVGKSGEDIWTDKYGRVKVQFHWDRVGTSNENSSCWIRVAQMWAGANWGSIFIPRIGQEVVVDFLEGDPDRPLITGSVYNEDNKPPYTLPDNQTQSGIKTRSTKNGTAETFNELRFEDKKDSEEIYFHAQKDLKQVVENNYTLDVGDSNADDGSQTITIWKNRTETVKEGDEKVTIEKGNRDVIVDTGNDTHQIKKGNRNVTIDKGDDTLTIKTGNQTIKLDAGKSTIEAAQSIELKVGSSSIKLTPTGVTIKGVQIEITGDAKADVSSAMTTVKGSAMLTLQGGVVKIN